jgi:hypothetical protein
MRTLRELQAAFRAALLDGADGAPAGPLGDEILADGLGAERRLAVYRHHVLATLAAALAETYPVVKRLVGDGFFAYASDAFVRRHPPGGPCVFEYGAGLAEFLAAFPPCRGLPYLADVARLEWAMHAALHAETAAAIGLDALRALPPERLAGVTLGLDASLALLSSSWPVDRIWRANQPGVDPETTVDLGAGGAWLEVRRLDDDVVWRALPPAEHAFRAALVDGHALERAAAAALDVDGAFDVAGALRALVDERLVTGVETTR